jgi:predicted Zn-dependent peptidase
LGSWLAVFLGSSNHAFLGNVLREELGISYGIRTAYLGRGLEVVTSTRSEWTGQVLEKVRGALERVRKGTFSQEDFESSRKRFKAQLILGDSTLGGRIIRGSLFGDPTQDWASIFSKNVDAMTREQFVKAIGPLLDSRFRVELISGQSTAIEKSLREKKIKFSVVK